MSGSDLRQHDRRDIVWINVTASPSAEWVARQITEAFPWDTAQCYMIRDRDLYLRHNRNTATEGHGHLGQAYRSSVAWQHRYAERLIGSIRQECLDQVIILEETHLREIMQTYADYHHYSRA